MANREPLRRADLLMGEGKFAEAAKLCDDFLRAEPSDAKAIFLKAQAMSNLEKDAEALTLFDRALQMAGPTSDLCPLIFHAKGNTLLWMEKLAEAESCYDQALKIDPGQARAWIEKARIAYRRQRFKESVQCCDNALSINPSSARAWNNKASALLELGQTEKCIACAQNAVKLRQDYAMAWLTLSKAYEKKAKDMSFWSFGRSAAVRKARQYYERAQDGLRKGTIFEGWE